jgi:NADH-quinone oxidoreductase subunit K
MDSLQSYLLLSSLLFSLGIYAVISRQNAVAILMGIELILNSSSINFIAFNRFTSNLYQLDGHIFTIFIIVLAAAEAAVALAIIINLFKNIGSVNVDDATELKG